ncbi:unnamed protein product [Lasius platythorax]
MAFIHLKFEQLFHFLRVLGTIANTWPPHPDIGKNKLFLRNLYSCVTIFIYVTVWISMVMNAYKNRNNDVSEIMKDLSHITTLMEAILNSILCTIKRKELQILVVNIEEFWKFSKDRERVILQKYIDRYGTFITTVAILFSMAGLAVICAPLFMSQELPLNVWYPFSTKPLLRKFILYFMHICAIEHVVFCLGMDVMIAIFFFYLAARMEILAFEIEQATDEAHVISSIQKHQEIIEFTLKTQRTLQHILFKTNITMAFTVISSGFPMLYIQSVFLMPEPISTAVGALQRIYITASAADDLREVSTRLGWSVYGASWIGKTQKMKSDIFIMLQKSQQPLLIYMGGLLPAFTREYYGNFVTTVLSYFMTMRAVIGA